MRAAVQAKFSPLVWATMYRRISCQLTTHTTMLSYMHVYVNNHNVVDHMSSQQASEKKWFFFSKALRWIINSKRNDQQAERSGRKTGSFSSMMPCSSSSSSSSSLRDSQQQAQGAQGKQLSQAGSNIFTSKVHRNTPVLSSQHRSSSGNKKRNTGLVVSHQQHHDKSPYFRHSAAESPNITVIGSTNQQSGGCGTANSNNRKIDNIIYAMKQATGSTSPKKDDIMCNSDQLASSPDSVVANMESGMATGSTSMDSCLIAMDTNINQYPFDRKGLNGLAERRANVGKTVRSDTSKWRRKIGFVMGRRNDLAKFWVSTDTESYTQNTMDKLQDEDYSVMASDNLDARLVGCKRVTMDQIIEYLRNNKSTDQIILLEHINEFWSEVTEDVAIHRCDTTMFLSLLNIDQSAQIYKNEFCGNSHWNFLITDSSDNKIVMSLMLQDHRYRTIIRTSDKVLPGTIEMWQATQPMSLEEIMQKTLPSIQLSKYYHIKNSKASNYIERYDQETISMNFKFGVMYQKANQVTEEEMFNNRSHSEQMQEFLDFIAKPVKLAEHKRFNGGLDTMYGLTGEISYYTEFENHEVMFHVSTLLPYAEHDDQQIERKRHIGNDIVTIVFQDPGARFCPSVISSQFLHVFICVQNVIGVSGVSAYKVAIAARSEISKFGPFIHGIGYYRKDELFRKCLFSKLINAQIAACNSSGKIGSLLRRRRQMLFDELFKTFSKEEEQIPRAITDSASQLAEVPLDGKSKLTKSTASVRRVNNAGTGVGGSKLSMITDRSKSFDASASSRNGRTSAKFPQVTSSQRTGTSNRFWHRTNQNLHSV